MELNTDLLAKYTARTTPVPTRPGCWGGLLVEVFRTLPGGDPEKVGEYARNYDSFYSTFHPFSQGGREYALYSRHYTATRVMSLPDCTDLGGEEPSGHGFCPTGYAVPYDEYSAQEGIDADPKPYNPRHDPDRWATKRPLPGGGTAYDWRDDDEYKAAAAKGDADREAWYERHPFVTRRLDGQFGFACGCVWGDDSGGWKLEYLDLSRVAEGVITRDGRLGYVEVFHPAAHLADAILLDDYDPNDQAFVTVAVRKRLWLDRKNKDVDA